MPAALTTCIGAVLVLAAAPPASDWDALLIDPAADARWVDAHTVRVFPRGGGAPADIDARSGARVTLDAAATAAGTVLGNLLFLQNSAPYPGGLAGVMQMTW